MKDWLKGPCARYIVELLAALLLYAVVLVVSLLWLKQHPAAPWKYAIALLPIVPGIGIAIVVVRYVRALDELQQRMQLESLSFAFMMSAVATFGYGFLQNVGLSQVNWMWVWPVMAVCWMVGQIIARQRYR